ncbi:MAG: hypothetical protein ACRD2G_15775, partial [Terriglobia bacterium]
DGANAFIEIAGANGTSALRGLTSIASGSLALTDGAVLTTNSGVSLSNAGQIDIGYGGNISGSTLNVGGGLSNTGTIEVGILQSDGALNVPGSVTQAGTVMIGGEGRLAVLNGETYFQTGGTTDVDGTLIATTLNMSGGTIEGDGTIDGTLVQTGGNLQPGDDPGSLTINGNYAPWDSTFTEEVGGGTAGTDYSVLDVTGGLDFIGSDMLSLLDLSNFTPTDGEVFDIINAGSIFGTFSNNDIAFAGGTFTVEYNTSGCNWGAACVDLLWNNAPPVPAAQPSSLLLLGIALLAGLCIVKRSRADLRF